MQRLRFVLEVVRYCIKVELIMMAMAFIPIMAGVAFIWAWHLISG